MTTPLVRYPDPAFQILDESFAKYRIFNAAVERLATGFRWAEGPVWFGDGRYVLWSDIPNDRIMRWDEETGVTSVFRKPSNFSNGNTRDRQGRLVTCEHDSRRVTRTEYDGAITVLMDRFEDKRLSSPNDVVVKSDDSVWFTDPPFGILGNYEGHVAPLERVLAKLELASEQEIAASYAEYLHLPIARTFSSNFGDEAQLREAFATEVLRDRGVPAARAAFYRVVVDSGTGPEYWGLYTLIEDLADGAMLEAQFGSKDGNLYKPEGFGADWTKFDTAKAPITIEIAGMVGTQPTQKCTSAGRRVDACERRSREGSRARCSRPSCRRRRRTGRRSRRRR